MNFKSWGDYKIKNKELNPKIYCKSHLKEMKLKPKKDVTPRQHNVYTGGTWKEFDFYTLNDCEPIKIRKAPVIRDLDININNICQSLYIINKSAKKSRDSKQKNYYERHHGMVSKCKNRQEELYNLKNDVMDKLIDKNTLKLKGYHTQISMDCNTIYLLYYEYKNYGFHVIENDKAHLPTDIQNLGEIGIISADVNRKTNIKFNEAVKLLEKYLKLD